MGLISRAKTQGQVSRCTRPGGNLWSPEKNITINSQRDENIPLLEYIMSNIF